MRNDALDHRARTTCTPERDARAAGVSLPAAGLEQLFGRERRCGQAAHRVAETLRDAREHLGVLEVRRRLDDRLRANVGIAGLEDPGADEDSVRAELHAERRV